jgi:hypothetical protein
MQQRNLPTPSASLLLLRLMVQVCAGVTSSVQQPVTAAHAAAAAEQHVHLDRQQETGQAEAAAALVLVPVLARPLVLVIVPGRIRLLQLA